MITAVSIVRIPNDPYIFVQGAVIPRYQMFWHTLYLCGYLVPAGCRCGSANKKTFGVRLACRLSLPLVAHRAAGLFLVSCHMVPGTYQVRVPGVYRHITLTYIRVDAPGLLSTADRWRVHILRRIQAVFSCLASFSHRCPTCWERIPAVLIE